MGNRREQIDQKTVGPEHFVPTYRRHRYMEEPFMKSPLCTLAGDATDLGGTSLVEIGIFTGFNSFSYSFIGDATDVHKPVLASEGGYNWALTTQTLDRGVEINFGGTLTKDPRNFVSTEDWFARILIGVEDYSGANLVFGFRKAGATVASLTEITDLFGIRILGDESSALAATSIITNLNNGGTSDYVTTALSTVLTDGTMIELEVRCVGRKGQAFINGDRVGRQVTFSFDDGDYLSPIFTALASTDLAGQIKTFHYQAGALKDRPAGTLASIAGGTQ